MDILKMLAELRSERQRLEEAILVVERLAMGGAKRRGRPPKWMTPAASDANVSGEQTGKRTVSSAARKRMAAAQRRRWAKVRSQERKTEAA